jgi:hypothetical protein
MDTHRQILGDRDSTTRTLLGSPPWEDLQERAASLCRFAARVLEELRPSCIGNALVERSILIGLHVWNVQVFAGDDLIGVDELPACLVRKIGAAVRDALVNMLHDAPGFAPCWRVLILGTECALGLLQHLFVPTEETRIVNAGAIAEHGKRAQPYIDACSQGRWR